MRFQKNIQPNSYLVQSNTQDYQSLSLSTPDALQDAPILIRADRFEIKEGEVLNTEGHDLIVIARSIVLNGTIRTTPNPVDDEPGAKAGSVYLAAAKFQFGPQALIDATGGPGGRNTEDPTEVFSPEEIAAFEQELKGMVTVFDQFNLSERNPNTGDAGLLLDSWEQIRDRITSGAKRYEDNIYEKYLERAEIVPKDIIPSERTEHIQNNNVAILNIWKALIAEAEKRYQAELAKRPNEAPPFKLISGEVMVHINTQIEEQHIEGYENKSFPFFVYPVKVKGLPGGAGGEVQIISATPFSKPNISNGPGLTQTLSRGTYPEKKLPGSREQHRIDLYCDTTDQVVFKLRKNTEDKTIDDPFAFEKLRSREITAYAYYHVEMRSAKAKLVAHPNDPFESTEINGPAPQSIVDASILTEVFERWGIEDTRGTLEFYNRAKDLFGEQPAKAESTEQ